MLPSAFSNAGDAELFRRDLMNIAKTTLSSKILTGDKEHFANLAVDAIMRLKGAWGSGGEGEFLEGWSLLSVGRLEWVGGCLEV